MPADNSHPLYTQIMKHNKNPTLVSLITQVDRSVYKFLFFTANRPKSPVIPADNAVNV